MDEPIIVPSRATRVTLFEDRAEVVRRATGRAEAGKPWIAVTGVSPYADDTSVQAKVIGSGGRVLAARVRRRVTQEQEVGREAATKLEEAERAAREAVTQADRAVERARAGQDRITRLAGTWRQSIARVPYDSEQGTTDGWRASYHTLDRELDVLATAEASALAQAQDARDELAAAQARLEEARKLHTIVEAAIEVQLALDHAGDVELEVVYRTPCALWRPEHLAQLLVTDDEATTGTLEITTWATAWQITGESWDGVEAVFSTARPSRAASPPLLTADRIALRRKTDEERSTIQVEARDQIVARVQAAEGARAVEEMPGVDDGGLPLSFSPREALRLPSHGHPVRVEIGKIRLQATVARVLVPELAPVAHYRATATLAGRAPLLAGPMRVARGTALVGRARLPFVAPGEPFAIGFGLDDAVRVRRTEERKQDQVAIIGTQRIEHTVHLYLSNLSDTERRVALTERVPVSEIAEVQISLLEARAFDHAAADGFLTAQVTVPARQTRELTLSYEVRAKSNVHLA